MVKAAADATGSQTRFRALAIAEAIPGSGPPPYLSLRKDVVCTTVALLHQRELLLLLPQRRMHFGPQ